MSSRAKRSKFEQDMANVLEPAGFTYESDSAVYPMYSKYTPDFVYRLSGTEEVWVEAKGWFRPGDRKKYKAIRDALGRHGRDSPAKELVFLLQAPNKKVQKGAQLTMSGWCEKEGLRWFSDPKELAQWATGGQK